MSAHIIQFKDPDLIWGLINAKHPLPADEGEITPNMERQREEFSHAYFEYGDYGFIEIDAHTLSCRLLTLAEAKKAGAA